MSINTPFCTHTHTPVSPEEEWKGIMFSVGVDSAQLRDERYDQIVHMVSAANGAEQFYQLSNNPTRSEGFKLAREQDAKAAQVRDNLTSLSSSSPASNPGFSSLTLSHSFGKKLLRDKILY